MAKLPKKGPGRPKGSKNRTSAEAQQAILDSLARRDEAQAARFAENPEAAISPHYLDTLDDKLFTQLVGRVLPREIKADVTGHLTWAQYVGAGEGEE